MGGEDDIYLSCVSALERTVGMAHFEPVGDEIWFVSLFPQE